MACYCGVEISQFRHARTQAQKFEELHENCLKKKITDALTTDAVPEKLLLLQSAQGL